MKVRTSGRAPAMGRLAGTAVSMLVLFAPPAQAQEGTRLIAATVYPDGASVERELRVPGGTRHVSIACVPAAVDVSTLQVDGDPDARLGDVRATALPASRVEECAPPVSVARRQALEQQRAALEAQRDADELAFSFLRQWGTKTHADAPEPAAAPSRGGAPASASRPGATAAELRRSALELLVDQARIKRDLAALALEESKVSGDQPVARGKSGWRSVHFDVWTPAAATLRVRYAVAGTFWRPSYRASLDTARSTLRIDRQAEIVQASGEDWSDVRIRLSTRQPRREAAAPLPTPWWLDLLQAMGRGVVDKPAPAPMMAAADERVTLSAVRQARDGAPSEPVAPPPWDVQMSEGDAVTEFAIAQPVTLASDGESHTLQIASQSLPATLKRRTTPRLDPAVYLLAQAARPSGVWPAGPLQAFQDGTLVGRSAWQPSAGEKFEIAMGRDDLMHVDVETPASFTQPRGVFGGSVERTAAAVYAIVNRHPSAVTVEMLDAAPVSRNAAITVAHKVDPAPLTTDWNRLTGVAAWSFEIAAGGTRRVSVSHSVTAPRDAIVGGL